MPWGLATVFIQRRLYTDGSSVDSAVEDNATADAEVWLRGGMVVYLCYAPLLLVPGGCGGVWGAGLLCPLGFRNAQWPHIDSFVAYAAPPQGNVMQYRSGLKYVKFEGRKRPLGTSGDGGDSDSDDSENEGWGQRLLDCHFRCAATDRKG